MKSRGSRILTVDPIAAMLFRAWALASSVAMALLPFYGQPANAETPASLAKAATASKSQTTPQFANQSLSAANVLPSRLQVSPSALRAQRARIVLKRHCARCHEAGQPDRLLPAAGLANILDLPRLADRADLIQPGRPEASPLYLAMLTRHMPYDVFHDLKRGDEPSADEIATLRRWIEGLPPRPQCNIGPDRVANIRHLIAQDLQAVGKVRALQRRYVSLAHMAELCGDERQTHVFRQAVAKLINLLSRNPKPYAPEPIGSEKTILAIELDRLGWVPKQWERLAGGFRPPPAFQFYPSVLAAVGTDRPSLPADLLAHNAFKPGLYAGLIDAPRSYRQLLEKFALQPDQSKANEVIEIPKSRVTGYSRTLTKVAHKNRPPLWIAADFAPAKRRRTGQRNPPGPQPLQRRAIFSLPNGLPAFALFNRKGALRANPHVELLPEPIKQAGGETAGLGCIACHQSGPLSRLGNSTASDTAQYAAMATPIGSGSPLHNLGIEPDLLIDGHEPVRALALRHSRDLDLRSAAAELGLPVRQLSARLAQVNAPLQAIARRLQHGLVSRSEFDDLTAYLLSTSAPALPATIKTAASPPPTAYWRPAERLRLSVWLDQPGYSAGDQLVVFAQANRACRLTVISLDKTGEATVLFPNEFSDDNRLQPARTVRIPGRSDKFSLRVDKPGGEQLIGICMAGDRANPPGIFHDFELHAFTLLGNWSQHLKTALRYDVKERRRAGRAKPKRKRKSRRRQRRARKIVPHRATKLPLDQAWASLTVPAYRPNAATPPLPAGQ
ncbi:MAG: DUF4384 domain-containing protein [Alphaproteobacteria bacterium]|nr:DUF4384 domain-containing protein [Alphaproteobacteria bacterium]